MRLYIFITFFLIFNYSQVISSTLYVGNLDNFKTIKSALEHCKNGDSVIVKKGFYNEKGTILINKSIYFIGIDYPIIDGNVQYEVITVNAENLVIKGFQIQNSGFASLDDPSGIKVIKSKNVTISDNKIYKNFFGIYIEFSSNCIIKNNEIYAINTKTQEIGNGIHCWKSDSLTISENNIHGHRDGLYFEFVYNSKINNNKSYNNLRYGLHFMFSNYNKYLENSFINNGAGVAVMFSKFITMTDNIFSENWGDAAYGLLLKEISDSYIEKNKFFNNTMGIYMEGTTRIIIKNNELFNNGWGMKIQASCLNNEIKKNNFFKNTFDVSTNGETVLNIFENNFWDKYEGYDLDKDGLGDVPYRPLSIFSLIIEYNPAAMLFFRSIMITLLDKSEKIFPFITPDNFIDLKPSIKSYKL